MNTLATYKLCGIPTLQSLTDLLQQLESREGVKIAMFVVEVQSDEGWGLRVLVNNGEAQTVSNPKNPKRHNTNWVPMEGFSRTVGIWRSAANKN